MINLRKIARLVIPSALALVAAGAIGIGSAAAATRATANKESAEVTVMVQPSLGAANDLTYTIVARNHGDGPAKNVTITLPFDASKVKLGDVQFSRPGAWISSTAGNALEIQTGRLGSGGDAVTATAHFAALVDPSAAVLRDRIAYSWDSEDSRHHGRSNLPVLNNARQPFHTLTTAGASDSIVFSSDLFAPNEPVVLWYNSPDGHVVSTEVKNGFIIDAASTNDEDKDEKGQDYALADADGGIHLSLRTRALAPGTYSMVAQGAHTGITAVGEFQVQ